MTLRLPSGYAGAKMLRYAFDDAVRGKRAAASIV